MYFVSTLARPVLEAVTQPVKPVILHIYSMLMIVDCAIPVPIKTVYRARAQTHKYVIYVRLVSI